MDPFFQARAFHSPWVDGWPSRAAKYHRSRPILWGRLTYVRFEDSRVHRRILASSLDIGLVFHMPD